MTNTIADSVTDEPTICLELSFVELLIQTIEELPPKPRSIWALHRLRYEVEQLGERD